MILVIFHSENHMTLRVLIVFSILTIYLALILQKIRIKIMDIDYWFGTVTTSVDAIFQNQIKSPNVKRNEPLKSKVTANSLTANIEKLVGLRRAPYMVHAIMSQITMCAVYGTPSSTDVRQV